MTSQVSIEKVQTAKDTLFGYANKLRLGQQIMVLFTMLQSIALTILLYTNSNPSDLYRNIKLILTTSISITLVIVSVGRFNKVAMDCEKIALLMSIYTSGIITDTSQIHKVEVSIQQTMSTLHTLWFPVPEIVDTADTNIVQHEIVSRTDPEFSLNTII